MATQTLKAQVQQIQLPVVNSTSKTAANWDYRLYSSLHKRTIPNQTLPLCYLQLVAESFSYYSAQEGIDPFQLALVVFILPSICSKISVALEVGITYNLRWWCFSYTNQAFPNVHTCTWAHFATCTVWWWWLYAKVILSSVLFGVIYTRDK